MVKAAQATAQAVRRLRESSPAEHARVVNALMEEGLPFSEERIESSPPTTAAKTALVVAKLLMAHGRTSESRDLQELASSLETGAPVRDSIPGEIRKANTTATVGCAASVAMAATLLVALGSNGFYPLIGGGGTTARDAGVPPMDTPLPMDAPPESDSPDSHESLDSPPDAPVRCVSREIEPTVLSTRGGALELRGLPGRTTILTVHISLGPTSLPCGDLYMQNWRATVNGESRWLIEGSHAAVIHPHAASPTWSNVPGRRAVVEIASEGASCRSGPGERAYDAPTDVRVSGSYEACQW